MKILNIFGRAEKRKILPIRTLGSAIYRSFIVYCIFLAIFTFSSMNIRTVEGTGLYALNESALRRYLEHILELGESSDRSLTGERPPHYVQELYDTLADEKDRYGRGYVPYEDGLFTVQAVTQDYKEYDSRQKDDFSVNLNFPLTKLWMKSTGVARAELVLELNRQALLSLPPRHYTLNVETQTLPATSATRADRHRNTPQERDYFSRRLSDNNDHFKREFVVLNVTRALRKTDAWQYGRNGKLGIRFDVRLSVLATDYAPPPEAVPGNLSASTQPRDLLDAAQVTAFFSTNARHDRSQPLLVLYSSDDEVYVYRRSGRAVEEEDETRDESFVERRRRRRQRRETQKESGEKSHVENDVANSETQPTCGIRVWPVDLSGLLHQRLMMPKRVNVNYCSGVCPFPVYDSHWNATNNAVIRSSFIYVRGQMTPAYVPDPMCVPRTLNSMSFLFSENNNVIVRILEQVVAMSCMCA